MDFQSADHGVSITGMNQYIDDINTVVLTEVAAALWDTAAVEDAVRAGWHGNAPEQFIANLNKAKEQMVETLKQLQNTFETELNGIKSSMLDIEANLDDEE